MDNTRLRLAAGAAALTSLLLPAAANAAELPPLPPLPAPLDSLLQQPSPQQPATQPTPQAASTNATAATARFASALQRSIVGELNVLRRAHRLPRLTVSAQLTRAGEEHARELALRGYFSHAWSDGSSFGTWIRRFYPATGARTWRAGENLLWSTPGLSAQRAIEMWLASPPHRKNMLDRRWRQVGLGVVEAENAPGFFGGQNVVVAAAEFGVRR
jgi:uncharacterized protein YkwD